MRKRNFTSLEVPAEMKCGRNAEVDLPIFGSPSRTSAEEERDISKSWPSGSTESGTSGLWQ